MNSVCPSGSAFAAIVSPIVGGYIIDKTGNWELTFVAGIALLIFGAILAFWMRPDRGVEDAPTPALSEAPVPHPVV